MPIPKPIQLTLPLPPSINQQYFTANGYHVLTPRSRRYRRTAEFQIGQLYRQDTIDDAFLAAARTLPLSLLLRFYFETPHRRDLDSGLKIVQDAIVSGGLGVDDRQVVDIRLLKYIDPRRPRVDVEVALVPEWDWRGDDGEADDGPLTVTLPMAPSVNDQYTLVHGRRRRSSELRRFQRAVAKIIGQSGMPELLPEALRTRAGGAYLACYLDFFFASGSRRDVDSGVKATLDATCTALGVNDNRVVDLHCTKRHAQDAPYIKAEFEPLDTWAFDAQHPVLVGGGPENKV
jgi:crossover junction endodeoxyribonuclease RusA